MTRERLLVPPMKTIVLFPTLFLGLLTVSCRKQPAEVEISETRALTSHDKEPVLNATSAEQFLPADVLAQIKGSGQMLGTGGGLVAPTWSYRLPAADWKVAEKKPLREVNLSFGEGEAQGEVYLSVVGGGIQPNVNRWFRQFGSAVQSIEKMGRLEFIGQQGYLVEAQGRYEPGMGRAGKDGQALLGAIVESEGRLVTVKMIGPESEVLARREQFISFVASLSRK